MKIKLFNTEARCVEEFSPLEEGKVSMYTCGPTIYSYAHIGNFRTYVFEDLLRRTLEFFGYSVLQVMNITDVDDKTIRGAIQQGISLKEFTDPYAKAFFEDLAKLNIQKAHYYPAATDYISEMIRLIEILVENGHAYRSASGSIYFAIAKFPQYGRLSHLKLDELKVNASGDNEADEYGKENIADFVLWKAFDPLRDGKIIWESPFGRGRPGWHIECSAMAMKLLGPKIDLHCGGVDNMFPHHENEIAQSECCTGKHFVGTWVHVEHLLVDHKKMSKSLGNFYTLRDLLEKGYTGREVRYLLLSTHYRTQLNFTMQGLEAARSSLMRLDDFTKRLLFLEENTEDLSVLEETLSSADQKFSLALAEDINISVALAALFDLVREIHCKIDTHFVGKEGANRVLTLLRRWDKVLGVLVLTPLEEEIPPEVADLLEKREQARLEKKYQESDLLRSEILKKGYIIEDAKTGVRLKRR